MGNILFKTFRIAANTLTRPTHLHILLRDFYKRITDTIHSDKEHLHAAMLWLSFSQDITGGNGCSGIYSFEEGWHPPYPETTGYIIPTFLKYGKITGNPEFFDRASKLGDWEIDIQMPSGAVRGGVGVNQYPIVFNTGQVILGWTALYNETKLSKYLEAAVRASEWLTVIQDSDGKWSRSTYNNIPHAYNIRVAWALLELFKITGNHVFRETAKKNIYWVLSQTQKNGWINYMGFTETDPPLTHTIAYTLRGLLECSFYFDDNLKNNILKLVSIASEKILLSYQSKSNSNSNYRGFLPGAFNQSWIPDGSFSCLTGNAQIAIIWLKLFRISGDSRFLENAVSMIDQLKLTQNLTSKNQGIRGGISGSYPIWGKYVPFGYPNWAAKFFADSLLLKNEIINTTQK